MCLSVSQPLCFCVCVCLCLRCLVLTELGVFSQGELKLYMEYMDAGSLQRAIERKRPLPESIMGKVVFATVSALVRFDGVLATRVHSSSMNTALSAARAQHYPS
jgi:hypothetical protein